MYSNDTGRKRKVSKEEFFRLLKTSTEKCGLQSEDLR